MDLEEFTKKSEKSDHIKAFEANKNAYQNNKIEYVPVTDLKPSSTQPRKTFEEDSIKYLAQSIQTHGILLPIIVSADADGKLTIIAGERRWRAAKLAGIKSVPCLFRQLDTHHQIELALIENLHREDLSPLDEAQTYKQLIDDHDLTHNTLAARIGKDRSTITYALRLLTLPPKIQADLNAKLITVGHAKVLCSLADERLQMRTHKLILEKKLSVRQTEDLIRNLKNEKSVSRQIDDVSPDLRYICDLFKGHFGTKVKMTGDKNKGKIEINYYSAEDLERISELVLGNS